METRQQVTSDGLLERDAELHAIERCLAMARDGAGGLVVIDGPAGVGKTALLRAARTLATRNGMRVLDARGVELERAFPFGVVRQLLDPVLRDPARDAGDLFAGAARLAAPLLGAGLDDGASPDPFTARHAL